MAHRDFLRPVVIVLALLAGLTSSVAAGASQCTPELQKSARQETNTIGDWATLHQLYQKYQACDSGTVSANFTYNAVTLLTGHWNEAAALAQQIRQDKPFGTFVYDHFNRLLSPQQTAQLQDLATNKCRPDIHAVCDGILGSLNAEQVVRSRFRMAN